MRSCGHLQTSIERLQVWIESVKVHVGWDDLISDGHRSFEKACNASSTLCMPNDGLDRADKEGLVDTRGVVLREKGLMDGSRLLRVTSFSTCAVGFEELRSIGLLRQIQASSGVSLTDQTGLGC